MLTVTVLVGNPKADSKTLLLARTLTEALLREQQFEATEIDLAHYTGEIFDWSSVEVSALTQRVATSDLVIVASPTYKAAYTGLLKAFLDRYPTNGLNGVVAVPVMTGGDLTHSLAVELTLRPLLVELGASVPSRGLYFVASRIDEVATVVDEWVEANGAPVIRALWGLPGSPRTRG
ncbi:NADPH-dependent FMN reductase [Lacisediminihabitans changchengi]|uniref:NAD(P)H-dependent oxidoreductase n=1 Tax=Lacisediminihabitans changchengi TaxID=2787634 RepID=A0A934SU29_9MICO|nr:NAD(P)H-dependent oxidoreductase [Lacisediminihabitans changchengi]MBK4348935.1 NAD(P)H-dependent oxidoreductase [Lacisediminihabitans changchengi]